MGNSSGGYEAILVTTVQLSDGSLLDKTVTIYGASYFEVYDKLLRIRKNLDEVGVFVLYMEATYTSSKEKALALYNYQAAL